MWSWPNSRQTNQMKTTWSYAKSCGYALVCTVWLWILCVQSSLRSPLQSSPLCLVWREFVCLCDCKINKDESEHSTEYGQFEGVHLQIRWSTGLFMCYGFVGAFSFFVFCSPESKSCGAIEICLFVLYNKLLLNHLWSCVLKLVSWFLWGQGTRFKKKRSWFYSCSFSPPPTPPTRPFFCPLVPQLVVGREGIFFTVGDSLGPLCVVSARHVVQDQKDIRRAMEFLHECDLLKIEDILPFFPDFVTIDHFKVSCRRGDVRPVIHPMMFQFPLIK